MYVMYVCMCMRVLYVRAMHAEYEVGKDNVWNLLQQRC